MFQRNHVRIRLDDLRFRIGRSCLAAGRFDLGTNILKELCRSNHGRVGWEDGIPVGLLAADLLGRLQPWTLLVARSGLGTINHTLLSIEAMHTRRIPTLGVIFSDGGRDENKTIVSDNLRTVQEITGVKVFGRLPREADPAMAREDFGPIGRAIFEHLRQKI